MQKDTEQPLAAAVGADDLFCCRDSSASRHATDQATVTLRVEAASAAETKVSFKVFSQAVRAIYLTKCTVWGSASSKNGISLWMV